MKARRFLPCARGVVPLRSANAVGWSPTADEGTWRCLLVALCRSTAEVSVGRQAVTRSHPDHRPPLRAFRIGLEAGGGGSRRRLLGHGRLRHRGRGLDVTLQRCRRENDGDDGGDGRMAFLLSISMAIGSTRHAAARWTTVVVVARIVTDGGSPVWHRWTAACMCRKMDGAPMDDGMVTPGRTTDGRSDRRWIALAEDGRASVIARASDPSEDDIAAAEDSLRRHGLSGWLAIMSSSQYVETMPTVMEVRPLASPGTTFAAAAEKMMAAMIEKRRRSRIIL